MNKSKNEFKEILTQLLNLSMEEGANLIKPEYTQDLYIEIEKMENPRIISICEKKLKELDGTDDNEN